MQNDDKQVKFEEGDEIQTTVSIRCGEYSYAENYQGVVTEIRSDGLIGIELESNYAGSEEFFVKPSDIVLLGSVCPDCGSEWSIAVDSHGEEYGQEFCIPCAKAEWEFIQSLSPDEIKKYEREGRC